MLRSFENCTTLTPQSNNLALIKPISIISLMRSLLLIGIDAIWLLSLVCMLMRIIASFLHYTCYLNFTKIPISPVKLPIIVYVLLLSCLYF